MARIAESLEQLRRQLNQMAPTRSKVSDGGVGDAAHSARKSDHNPDAGGVVHARDFTHDPPRLDCNWLAQQLIASGDRRIKYIIWNRRIWQGGVWKDYTGTNAHTKHLHLSVVGGAAGDSAAPWHLGVGGDDFLMGLPQDKQDRIATAADRILGMLPQQYWRPIPNSSQIEVVPANAPGARPAAVLDTVAGNFLVQQFLSLRTQLSKMEAELQLVRGETVDDVARDEALRQELGQFVEEWRAVTAATTEEVKK